MEMKVTVIGMWGGYPKKDGPCSGYLVEQDGFSMLIDCGSGVLVKLQEFIDLNEIHDVLLSHYHYDHSSDVGAYMFSRLVNTQLGKVDESLTIYGPQDEMKEREFRSVPYTEFKAIDEGSQLQIGPFQLSFFKTSHPVETYAMKISNGKKSIVYTADTSFTEGLVDFSKGADLLIAECSLYEGMDGKNSGHMNAKDAGVLARKAGARKTLLTHLPHYGNIQELVESAEKEGALAVELARSGMIISI